MTKIEIGIGAVIAAIAGLGWASTAAVNIGLLVLGGVLIVHGAYDVYIKPNFRLEHTLKRWLERHYWTVKIDEQAPKDKFYFVLWAEDTESHRKVMLSRERGQAGLLAFQALVELDAKIVQGLNQMPSDEQQRLYQDLHILFATMGLVYHSQTFLNIACQDALPINAELSEHSVDLKAKGVSLGFAAARSLIRKAVI